MVRRTENNRMGLTHSEQFPAPFLLCTNGVPFQWRLCHRCLQAVLACSTNAGKLLCRDAADIDKARAWNTAECLTLCWAAKACVQPAVAAAGDQTAVPAFSPGWQNWGAGSETVCSEANLIGCLSLKGTWAFFLSKTVSTITPLSFSLNCGTRGPMWSVSHSSEYSMLYSPTE